MIETQVLWQFLIFQGFFRNHFLEGGPHFTMEGVCSSVREILFLSRRSASWGRASFLMGFCFLKKSWDGDGGGCPMPLSHPIKGNPTPLDGINILSRFTTGFSIWHGLQISFRWPSGSMLEVREYWKLLTSGGELSTFGFARVQIKNST